ncbi:MAG: cysteine rich repeat-containing protein [Woeseiaceae bacterium]|nr:cysteine rich repeat-containing protein [Woeseiaceae bacterium]
MKKISFVLFAFPCLVAGMAANAQESLLEHLVSACKTDIRNYCSQVTPGNGRMLHCMAAHEDKISGQCQYAFYQAASILEQLAVATAYVASECAADIEKHCGDVRMGEGRILACLEDHEEVLGDACVDALADTVGE